MFKRFLLFGLVNIGVVITVSIILSLLGVEPYLTANGLNYSSLAVFCLIWGFVGSFISLLLSKKMAKWMMRVEVLDPQHGGEYGELVRTVHRLAKAAGLEKMPEVGVYPGEELNAFATGPSRNNSLVAVSDGLLRNMTRDEVEGVLGHEVAHIANGDMVTMALIQGVVNAFVMFFARIAAFAVQQFLRGDDEEGESGFSHLAYMFTVIAFELFFGLLASMVVAAFSRQREFRADAGGAVLAGRAKMEAALKRLQSATDIIRSDSQSIQSMKISSKPSKMLALFSTHPPLEVRIDRLRKFAS